MTSTCKFCNQQFEQKKEMGRGKGGPKLFCSNECLTNSRVKTRMKTLEFKTCIICSKDIPVNKNGFKIFRKFCSVSCRKIQREKSTFTSQVMYKYGITTQDYDKLLTSQNGACAICKSNTPGLRNWHIDHDHVTNRVRGLLCHHCNLGLGNFKDNVKFLTAAVEYLDKK